MTHTYRFIVTCLFLGAGLPYAFGQGNVSDTLTGRIGNRTVTSAVPFLTISPDARSGAMGDAGVAISPDANSIYWNPAKLAFAEKKVDAAVSYTPWLRNLVPDMYIANLAGFYKVDENQAVGVNFTYFDMGSIQFTDDNGQPIADFNPQEFTIGGAYSRKLSENFGLAVGLRFIHSNLSGNLGLANTNPTKAGNTAAGDIALFYTNDWNVGGRDVTFAFGANLSNIGGKISYSSREYREFLPTNLRFGPAFTYNIDPYNKFTFTIDFNKLLVPTPDSTGSNYDQTFISGALSSFGDAPDGFSEELQEVMIATGIEYWYNDVFSARAGYFSENKNKGNRKYFTVGAGIRMFQNLGLDFAYLLPTQRGTNNPLAETIRFTVRLNLNGQQPTDSQTDTGTDNAQ